MAVSNDQTAAISRASFRRRSARVLLALFTLVLIGAVVINAPTMLAWIGQRWAVFDRVRTADAAVVLGGGYESRPAAAAQLFHQGTVRFVLVSTAGAQEGTDANINRQALLKLGVPATAIIEFGNDPTTTYEEARDLAAWTAQNHLTRVIVPTETFASRRVRWILRHELGKVGVNVRVETLTPKFYGSERWWATRSGAEDFAAEIIKYLYYRIRYWRS